MRSITLFVGSKWSWRPITQPPTYACAHTHTHGVVTMGMNKERFDRVAERTMAKRVTRQVRGPASEMKTFMRARSSELFLCLRRTSKAVCNGEEGLLQNVALGSRISNCIVPGMESLNVLNTRG